MKKILLTLIAMLVLGVAETWAYEWTDDNGVTWTFSQKSYTINGVSQKLWTITDLSGYGENVVFPEVVYNGTTACTVEAIGSYLLYNSNIGTTVTLPASIKFIDYSAFNFRAGTVTMLGTIPPVLRTSSTDPPFGSGVTILVPSASVSTYRNADLWSSYALRIISSNAETNYTVTATAQTSGSGIHAAVGESNLGNVMTLKVSGTINSYDIRVMRDKMPNLHHLDLTNAFIVANQYSYYETTTNRYCSEDNVLGAYAFEDMVKLMTVKLPKTIKSIGDNAFSGCMALTSVTLQTGLTSIGEHAFSGCYSLTSITLPAGLTSIGDYAFKENSSLTSITVPTGVTSIGSYTFDSCSSLTSVTLPTGLTSIGDWAFSSCRSLTSITLPTGLTSIGEGAFSYCRSLTSVTLKAGLTSIGLRAFKECSSLTSITLPSGLTSIGECAFYNCSSLTSIVIPDDVTTLEYGTFYLCTNLASVTFPQKLRTISGGTAYSGAFEGCTSLTCAKLPTSLQKIFARSFKNCDSLAELHIPSSINYIGEDAFRGCSALKDIYAYSAEPTTITSSTFSTQATATLYVPAYAYYNYYFDNNWCKFANIEKLSSTESYDYFYITKDFFFENQTGTVSGKPNADLNAGSGLVVNLTNQTLQLNEVHFAQDASKSASIIANNNLQVEKLYFDIAVTKNKWYFLSFPFRVKLANTTSPGDFVFRYYDGQTRATSGSGGWKNVTTTYLNAGQGYIYQTNTDGTLTLMVVKADMDFSGNTRNRTLNTYTATDTKNASWNLVGNMHPSYYDIAQTGYTAPITVWNGSSYVAKRAGDDQYSLSPFQSFFVQKPSNVNQMSFPAAGRYTKTQWDSYVASQQSSVKGLHAPEHSERAIVNLTIDNGEDVVDETRVVFNAATSTDYEMDCDAAKFMSDQPVPQLYTLGEDGTQYAINERPAGKVTLCYVAPSDGELSISAPRMDQPVYLQDNVLGITHDLSLGAYTFTTEAGTFENRFVLRLNNPTTGIADMSDEIVNGKAANDQWFDLQGCQHNGAHLPKGVYVVKSGAKSIKVVKQ